MSPSTPANGWKAIEPDPLAYLDQAWEALTPSAHLAAAAKSIMNAPAPHAERSSSIPLRALDSTRSDTPQTSSPASSPSTPLTYSMEVQIERQAKALAELNQQLGQLMSKTRTLGALLDQSTAQMTEQLQTHQRALRASISVIEANATSDLKKARQRLSRTLSWLVLVPVITAAALCVLIAAATWAWAQTQISAAQTAQAQIQPRPSPPPSASGRRR